MDLFSGYHQVCIDPNSRKLTAFTTPDGEHLQYNRLAFGLSNASAHFMHAMQTLFQHSINRYCQVYLDDIIVFSPNAHQHTDQLRDTLNEYFTKGGVEAEPSEKCSFAQLKVKYLGHWFSGDGYGMDSKIVEAVRGFKELKNARDCKSFLCLCGYYRKFCRITQR